ERADEALRALEQPLELLPRQPLERQQVAERPIASQLFRHRTSPSPAHQRARITAAAALSTSARPMRRRRCPLARRSFSAAPASSEEKRSSTRATGSDKRRSSSAAKARTAALNSPSPPTALYGAPTTRSSGASARTSRAIRSDRKSTRLNSSHSQISYAVFCLKKKTTRSAPGAEYAWSVTLT